MNTSHTSNKAPAQADSDQRLVKEVLLLPVILDVLEKDAAALDAVKLKMKSLHIRNLRHIQDRVTVDLASVRRQLREHGIKVYREERTENAIESNYVCRGYHHSFELLWRLVRAEVEERLAYYMNIDITKES